MLHFLPSNGWHALFSNTQLYPCTHRSTSPNSPSLLMTRPWSRNCCLPSPPPPLPPIMSCFPTVGEWDKNGRRAAKSEMEKGKKKRERETVRKRRRRWLKQRDTRGEKLEGGRVQQREWCKVVGNQGRRKCEAGVWTEWRGKETWETEDKERVQLVRWLSFISQLESEEDIRGFYVWNLFLLHIFIFLLSRQYIM